MKNYLLIFAAFKRSPSFLLKFLIATAVIGSALQSSTSKAAVTCAELFSEGSSLSENHAFKVELYKLEINYGGKLEVEQSEGKSGLKFIILKDQQTKKEIAELDYRYDETTNELEIKWIESTKKNLGVAHLLFTVALHTHPNTKRITTAILMETNEAIVKENLSQGMTPENAIKQTPAYKLRKSFGYSILIKDSITEDYGFTVEKPQN